MEDVILEALDGLGLSPKEVRVYVSLLELGSGPVQAIAERSGINRVTVYPLLSSLSQKGFVSTFTADNKTHFKPLAPGQILDLLKEKEHRLESALPLLKTHALREVGKTSVELFKGPSGIISFLDKIYGGSEKQLFAYGNYAVFEQILKYPALHARKTRALKGIRISTILAPMKMPPYTDEPPYKALTQIRINPILTAIKTYTIFGKGMVGTIEVSSEPIAVLIENPEIARQHKMMFDLLAKGSKRISH